MASRKALLIAAAAMAVVVVGALLPATASAENYVVGGNKGWNIDVYYNDLDDRIFKVGDTLDFRYPPGSHNVVILQLGDWESFQACMVMQEARTTLSSGIDTVSLSEPGRWFFICDIDDHCAEHGMRFTIVVVE